MRSKICSFIFLHVRNHGVEAPENFLELTVKVNNAWNLGDLNNVLYPCYVHHQCKGWACNINFNLIYFLEELEARTPEILSENFDSHVHYCFFNRKDYESRMVETGCKKFILFIFFDSYNTHLVDNDARALIFTFFGDKLLKKVGNSVHEFIISLLSRFISEECCYLLT